MSDIKIGCGVKGMYKIQVLENGRVVEDRPWAKNMILNQGLDYALNNRYSSVGQLFSYHCVGTGATAVSATDTGLVSESKRTSTRLTGYGNTGRSISGNTATFRYTWDHSVEGVGGANYSEHGVSPYSSAGANLFARSLIAGGTVSVAEGQQLRVIYDVSVTVTPSVPTAATVGGTGWPVAPATNCDGYAVLLGWDGVVGTLSTEGSTGGAGLLLMASTGSSYMDCCSALTLPGGVGDSAACTPITGGNIGYTVGTYTSGSYTRSWIPSEYATASSFSSTSIIGWHMNNFVANSQIAFKYGQNQTKANTHRLRYPSITVTWARA